MTKLISVAALLLAVACVARPPSSARRNAAAAVDQNGCHEQNAQCTALCTGPRAPAPSEQWIWPTY